MAIFDKIQDAAAEAANKDKDVLAEHEEQIEQAIDKVGDFVDERTANKYADKVDQAQDFLKDNIGKPNA